MVGRAKHKLFGLPRSSAKERLYNRMNPKGQLSSHVAFTSPPKMPGMAPRRAVFSSASSKPDDFSKEEAVLLTDGMPRCAHAAPSEGTTERRRSSTRRRTLVEWPQRKQARRLQQGGSVPAALLKPPVNSFCMNKPSLRIENALDQGDCVATFSKKRLEPKWLEPKWLRIFVEGAHRGGTTTS